jgi:hypothetical protein
MPLFVITLNTIVIINVSKLVEAKKQNTTKSKAKPKLNQNTFNL